MTEPSSPNPPSSSTPSPSTPSPSTPAPTATATPDSPGLSAAQPASARRGPVVAVAVALAALVVAGVGWLLFAPGGTDTPSAEGTESGTPTVTIPMATVDEYTSVVTPSIADVRQTWREYETSCHQSPGRPQSCPTWLLVLDIRTSALATGLQEAARPGGPTFVGAPPTEIAALVADTLDAARTISDAIPEDPYATDDAAVTSGAKRLLDAFDRWEPYL